jgi:glyoxylase-like metal-dependent hydrolase (beta-lactamase superfamily II)
MTADFPSAARAKPPRQIFDTIFAFPPNRDTMGGTAYLIKDTSDDGAPGNILVDSPAWDEAIQAFLEHQGGVRWLFITHRANLGKAAAIHQSLGCEVVIQEQEAYLLPSTPKISFQQNFRFSAHSVAFWTPGYSPGAACLYHSHYGGGLFTGRHLLPNREGQPMPLRFSKTFHWPRQLRSVQMLQDRFSEESLAYLCPGANTGFLRGKLTIDDAYHRLQQLNVDDYLRAKPLL